MSTQLITSNLLVGLSTEEQQLLSGGYKKPSDDCNDGDEKPSASTSPLPSVILGYKITAVPFSYCGTGDTSKDSSDGGVM